MTTLLALFLMLVVTFLPVEPQHKTIVVASKLEFREFFDPSTTALKPSEKLLRLNNKQIRIVGFMAQMENAPTGAFYLCSRPVKCDESGAGIGDLPIDSVLVIAPAMKGKKIPFIARALAVTGRLEVGSSGETENAIAPIRLILALPESQHISRFSKPKLTNLVYKRRKNL